MLVFISLLLSLNSYILEFGGKDVLNEWVPLFLYLWCWLWTNVYCWSRDSLCEISCISCINWCEILRLLYVSVCLFCHSRENFIFDSRLRALYKKKLHWVKSNLWSNQDNTTEFYRYSEYLSCGKPFIQSSTLHK